MMNVFSDIHHIFLMQKIKMAPQVGLEPTTLRLTAACSTG